jgi:hypothetical protein
VFGPRSVWSEEDATKGTSKSAMSEIARSSSRLPTELYMEVLNHYYDVRGNLDTSQLPLSSPEPRSWTVSADHFKQWRGKSYPALVSRQWCILSSPLLYRHICIVHLKRLRTIARSIEVEPLKQNGSDSRPNKGFYVKRLDIAPLRDRIWTTAHIKSMLSIVRLCPNLEIFSDQDENPTPLPVVLEVMETFATTSSKPRHLRWSTGDFGFTFTSIQSIFQFGTIEVLMLEVGHCVRLNGIQPNVLSMPCLHTLGILGWRWTLFAHATGLLDWAAQWDLPVLTRFVFPRSRWETQASSFFIKHNIQALDLSHSYSRDPGGFPIPVSLSLTEMLINPALWNAFDQRHPNLERVGLFMGGVDFPLDPLLQDSVEQCIDRILRTHFPKLSIVKLVGCSWKMLEESLEGQPNLLRKWEKWGKSFQERDIRFEDTFGDPFTPKYIP